MNWRYWLARATIRLYFWMAMFISFVFGRVIRPLPAEKLHDLADRFNAVMDFMGLYLDRVAPLPARPVSEPVKFKEFSIPLDSDLGRMLTKVLINDDEKEELPN